MSLPAELRPPSPTLIQGLIALAPKKRPNRLRWVLGGAVLYVACTLGLDLSVRDAIANGLPHAQPSPAMHHAPPPATPPMQVAPPAALAAATIAAPPPTGVTAAEPPPIKHAHRRAAAPSKKAAGQRHVKKR